MNEKIYALRGCINFQDHTAGIFEYASWLQENIVASLLKNKNICVEISKLDR